MNMDTEEIMHEVNELGIKIQLFEEMKRLEEEDPFRFRDFKLLLETAFNNINNQNK